MKNSTAAFNRKAFKEINDALKKLPKEFSLTRRRNILKKGLDPFISAAKSKAPKDSGELAESIGTKTFRNNKEFVFGGVVTKKKVKTVTNEKITVDGFYAKFIEYGFRHIAWPDKGVRIRTGLVGGALAGLNKRITNVKPKPFLRPAWDETKGSVKNATIKLTEKRVKAYERKVKKN